jgi:uncharacterized membrane protein (DUF4010 family)
MNVTGAMSFSPPPMLPQEAMKIVLTLAFSALIGLEREEHKATDDKFIFGGIRTYPLIGLLGYALAMLSGSQLIPASIGFAVMGALMWLSYQHKLQSVPVAGMTTELSALATYVVGALVALGHFWVAGTITIVSALLLELKIFLEGLSRRIPAEQIFTFTKFLLLTVVILPVVPNQDFGPYRINPFKTWLVVVAVSAISYLSYLLQIGSKGRGGTILSALLGGAYSSTLTTIVLAKRARDAKSSPHLFAGAILMASGVMYIPLAVLIGIFNAQLLHRVGLPLLLMAVIGLAAGWLWSRIPDEASSVLTETYVPRNPLELWAALLFGGLFVAMLVLTRLAAVHLGRGGVFGLAALMGLSDIDPFVLSLTQSAGAVTTVSVAASAIIIAAASNYVVKGFYAFGFADCRTGVQTFWLLLGLSLLGCAPLLWTLQGCSRCGPVWHSGRLPARPSYFLDPKGMLRNKYYN